MKSAALDKQKNRVLHPPDEVVGIETGNDLSKMLSSEMYMLGDPLLEMLFYQKYTDKALLQWEMVGHEPEHKGPIICVIDGSGSMGSILTVSGDTNITKEVWSKAVAIGGLFEIARRQRRDFVLMQFGAHGDLKTFHFPWKIRATMEEIILAADFFFDSGDTTFEEWMQEAPKLAEQSVYEKADLVIIGDGLAYIRPEILERYNAVRKAKQMHAQGILLARPGEIADGIEALESVVDKDAAGKPRVITISDLNEDADALDMMFSL